MTEPLTRRALRDAERKRPTRRRRRRAQPRSPFQLLFGAGAVILLACSAGATIPAEAAVVESRPVLASQLLSASQSYTVDGQVKSDALDTPAFDAKTTAPTAAQSDSSAVTAGGLTNADWAALVLSDASLPVTRNNLTVMLQWMDSENSPTSWWLRNNPLNNGLGSGGGSGLGSYPDLRTAASYVARQLDRTLFAGIAAALEADSDPTVTAQAIEASAWAGSHYGGGTLWHAVDVPIVSAPASAW